MALRFLRGAGGYEEDRPLADAIAAELERPLTYPRFPDDDMSFDHQASPMRTALDAVSTDDDVAAHSFGASILLRALAERERETPRRIVVLAMPDWSHAARLPRAAVHAHDCGGHQFDGLAITNFGPKSGCSSSRYCSRGRDRSVSR